MLPMWPGNPKYTISYIKSIDKVINSNTHNNNFNKMMMIWEMQFQDGVKMQTRKEPTDFTMFSCSTNYEEIRMLVEFSFC